MTAKGPTMGTNMAMASTRMGLIQPLSLVSSAQECEKYLVSGIGPPRVIGYEISVDNPSGRLHASRRGNRQLPFSPKRIRKWQGRGAGSLGPWPRT